MTLREKLEAVNDEASFLQFVQALLDDRCRAAALESAAAAKNRAIPPELVAPDSSGSDWQNATIESFLEGALAWAEDSQFGARQGLAGASPWRKAAVFLCAGKIYE